MVNLTRIYTRTGDAGTTRLGDMSETSKNDPRLHAYADVDEAGAHLGLALALGGLDADVVAVLTHVQNDLFDVGADLCTPSSPTRSTRRCASSRTTSTASRAGATTTTSSCPTCAPSSSTAARPAPRTCTSHAPSYAAPSAPRGRPGPSTTRR